MLETCHILAGFPEELAHPAEEKASMQCGLSLSPLDPIFLLPRRIRCHAASKHAFLVLPNQYSAAPSMASGGSLTFTTIITPQGTCQLLCSVVIKTSTLKIQGVFPSVPALLCVGRLLIHGSILQPSHDRWVGWSEIQDLVTHELLWQLRVSLSLPAPKIVARLLVLPEQCPFSLEGAAVHLAASGPGTLLHCARTAPPEHGCGGPIHLTPTARKGKASLVIHAH